jgi:hypothetical protein
MEDQDQNSVVDETGVVDGVEETTETGSQPVEQTGQVETETTTELVVSDEEKPEPFHKDPAWQERIGEIEQKYGTAAKNWDTVSRLAATDPDFALVIIEKMEKAGEVPEGTYEKAKSELKTEEKEKKETKETKEPEVVLDPKLQEALLNNPDLQYARQLKERALQEEARAKQKAEEFLQNFEAKRPEIAKSKNPLLTRQAIAVETQRLMAEKGLKYEDAINEAYLWIVKRESVMEEYREKGEIEGLARNIQEDVVTTNGGSAQSSSSTRRLTPDEENARASLGFTKEEYVKYLDDPNSGIID